MSVKLRTRINDGKVDRDTKTKVDPNAKPIKKTITYYLDIYDGGKRTYEFLPHLKTTIGNSPADRQIKKENLELAKKIAVQRAQEMQANDYNVATEHSKKIVVIDWMNAYAKKYDKADNRVINAVVNKFSEFLNDTKNKRLVMKDFSENIAMQFRDKLKKECVGEGAKSYFNRFKKIVKQAYRDKLLTKNPCEFVDTPKGDAKEKDVLTFEELQKLAETETQSIEVKKAFLFCAVSVGLRWVDVKALTWQSIDIPNRMLQFKQSKTKKWVKIALNDSAITLLGEPGNKKDKVFDLPSSNGANKALKSWVDRAKIEKHITFHCARHSYGTALIFHGTDIFTTSKLLGHSNLSETKRYVRQSDELKKQAVNNLPKLNLQFKSVE
ncbi:MAG TPA: tyrosine-type recombinase/integrase [Puia sp.]|jgi:integrase/recombinase XerD|nr:tyrosine-type recombinase/integrase [Puia sp.]